MNHVKSFSALALSALLIAAVGCASKIKQAEIPEGTNLPQKIAELDEWVDEGYKNQYDVLAPKSFNKAQEWLKEAKEDLADGDSPEEVRESVGYAMAYLNQASSESEGRESQVDHVLKARMTAMNAGAKTYPETRDRIKTLDDRLRDASYNFDRRLSSEEKSRLQKDYLALELKAIQNRELADARAKVGAAKEYDARRKTPETLERAETDIKTAENVIAAERRSPMAYDEAVSQANQSAQDLIEILGLALENEATEPVAVKLWRQERAIGNLQGNLEEASQSLESTQAGLAEVSGVIAAQDRMLASVESKIDFQEAIDEIRSEFSEEQAEVYQQGDRLIIRLKQVDFPIGSADVPEDSVALLEKVNNIIQRLDTESVEVQGHTDSTGGEKINGVLSEKRAQSVANFFKEAGLQDVEVQAKGYSFSKPIASNRTKEGRAQNRRVDVVIQSASQERIPSSVEEED